MKNKIEDLRNHLFATLESLQDEAKPMEIARAKAISEVAGRIIDSAKVEVEFMCVVKRSSGTDFIPVDPRAKPLKYGEGDPDADGNAVPARPFTARIK